MQQYVENLNTLDDRDCCCCKNCGIRPYMQCKKIRLRTFDTPTIYNAKDILKKIESHLEKYNCIDDKCQELISLDEKLNQLMVKLEECAWRHEDIYRASKR